MNSTDKNKKCNNSAHAQFSKSAFILDNKPCTVLACGPSTIKCR